MVEKPITEMTEEELKEAIADLRARRIAKRDSAPSRSATSPVAVGEAPKARPPRKGKSVEMADESLEDLL